MLNNKTRNLKKLNSNYPASNKARNKFKNKSTPPNPNYTKPKTCKTPKRPKLPKSLKTNNNYNPKLKLKRPN